MKRKIFRIELKERAGVAQDIAVLACLSNGGVKYISLQEMEMIAKSDVLRYPSLNTDVTVHLIGDNNLTIDKGTKNLLAITEVEILELVEEDAPTLNRQCTIADKTANELLT